MLIKIVDTDKTYVLSLLQTFFISLNFKKIFMIFYLVIYPLKANFDITG